MVPEQFRIELLLAILDRAFDRRSWHGPNLKGSLRGLDVHCASWRPSPQSHSIWELMLHCAYWKYVVHRRLRGERKGSFAVPGSNWFTRPMEGMGGREWKEELRLLTTVHRALRAAIAELTDAELAVTPPGSRVSNFEILSGIAMHDLYHAGQIQRLKRQWAEKE